MILQYKSLKNYQFNSEIKKIFHDSKDKSVLNNNVWHNFRSLGLLQRESNSIRDVGELDKGSPTIQGARQKDFPLCFDPQKKYFSNLKMAAGEEMETESPEVEIMDVEKETK